MVRLVKMSNIFTILTKMWESCAEDTVVRPKPVCQAPTVIKLFLHNRDSET